MLRLKLVFRNNFSSWEVIFHGTDTLKVYIHYEAF